MLLKEWLTVSGLTQMDIAAALGTRQGSVHRYCEGIRMPTREMMALSFKMSDGAVTPNDFYKIGPRVPVPPKGSGEWEAVAERAKKRVKAMSKAAAKAKAKAKAGAAESPMEE